MRAVLGEHADRATSRRARRGSTSATAIRLTETSMWCARSSKPGFEIRISSSPVPHLVPARRAAATAARSAIPASSRTSRCARSAMPPRREPLRDQLPRVRPRDLEDVEVGVELDATEPSVAIALSRITNRVGSRRFIE